MAVEIKSTEQDTYTVNGKELYRDMDGTWIAKEELTTAEQRAWSRYKESVIDSKINEEIFPFGG